ncbi:uncharacterized protein LOC121384453 [Gigantopelta aegis]|uniref:uncharacterized protein LOC121384453 n=1 Tax=Gigantopelta aegis TaxID=1735272 RepID=UPI001B88DA37|nr:uncharacterized protein LOC121384453 [Gigantopelta aegis]
MLVSLDHIMGCGRSKCDSQNSIDDVKDHKLIKPKSIGGGGGGKAEKNNKISDWKENEDPVRTANTKVSSGSQQEKSSRKQEEKLTASPLSSRPSNVNGNLPNQKTQDADNTKPTEKKKTPTVADGKLLTVSKDKDKTQTLTNQTVLMTSSQVEFFRLLDEKIESGRDYLSHSESED